MKLTIHATLPATIKNNVSSELTYLLRLAFHEYTMQRMANGDTAAVKAIEANLEIIDCSTCNPAADCPGCPHSDTCDDDAAKEYRNADHPA